MVPWLWSPPPQLEGSLGGPGAALAQRRDAEPDDHGVLEAATMIEFKLLAFR